MDTGYEHLDKKFELIAPGEITLLAGPAHVGKTSLAVNLAHQRMLNHEDSILFLTLDEDLGELGKRFIHLDTGIPLFRNGDNRANSGLLDEDSSDEKMTEDNEYTLKINESARKFQEQIESENLNVFHQEELTVAEIQNLCSDHFPDFDFLIIDYLEAIEFGDNSDKKRSEREKLIVEELKKLARQREIPLLVLSKKEKDELEFLQESSDKIAVLGRHGHCDEKRQWDREMKVQLNCIPEPAELEMIYNATGSTGSHELLWEAPLLAFRERSEDRDKIISDVFSDLKK
ncbi:DnaB-like helicase C-terminal domain-containing protein [Halarsenatibacter silvermanii]|uniref:DnaB-like helicase C terminal domain-containing protein n=1 Tax=Halarsenatibacter silvermanii TaxID=321763 RepID=A0A1G9L3B5_9FIRM|nr:DnaB-like helicase C-terminal domain-containing protein [Halarsenatibacter silvermanii]SDL56085.1 DnaB-like helicase C terminal domain-containing protein [Halarsenatibacter silvermanii]